MVRPDLEERGYRVFEVSAVAHTGLKELSFALAELVAEARAAKPKEEATRIVIRPKAVDDAGFTVTREEDGTSTACAARSRNAGSARPTSTTTRPSATSRTASTASASRRS